VDETGDFIRREDRLLLTSTSLTLKDAWQIVTQLGGFLIPAHVNRKAFGLFEVLGFIPEDLPVELLEISRHLAKEDAVRKYPQINGYPFIQSGDVHRLEEFLGVNQFTIEAPNIAEIRKAAQSQGERSLSILY
jgi:hypothetical protein